MVTSYNLKDMVSFGKFSALWQKKGMLEMDPDGNPIISKEHVENWKVGNSPKGASNYSICPKALNLSQKLAYMGMFVNSSDGDLIQKGTGIRASGIADEAKADGVVIAYPHKGEIVVVADEAEKFLPFLSIRQERDDFEYVHVSVPFATFPITDSHGHFVTFGACFHESDIAK